MLLFLFLVALTAGAASSSEEQNVQLLRGSCPSFWFSFNGRCYRYVPTDMTWAEAEFSCVSKGGNLVSIRSEEEHVFVKYLISNYDHSERRTWIGLSDLHKEGRWMWSDGSKVIFDFWSPGEPNDLHRAEHCTQTNYGIAKKWGDVSCNSRSPSVCVYRNICS